MQCYISIAGVMGSGKTTVSKLLAKELGYVLFEEKVNENKFLPLYYKEPNRWSFHSQLFYLNQKAEQMPNIESLLVDSNVIQDTPIYQDYLTYARGQYILKHMNHDEFNLYEKYFNSVVQNMRMPDLIVQLNVPPEILLDRIKKRNRVFEKDINIGYLKLLVDLQSDWLKTFPNLKILSINTNDLSEILSLVKEKLSTVVA